MEEQRLQVTTACSSITIARITIAIIVSIIIVSSRISSGGRSKQWIGRVSNTKLRSARTQGRW